MKGLIRALLGAVLALVAAELSVRRIYTLSVVYEPGIGYVNAPGHVRWGIEGIATSTWTTHGVRVTPGTDVVGPTHGGVSVLVLGDSFTEGLMVDDHEVFPAVAQAVLLEQGVNIALINAGRSTMSAADYVALAPRYKELFRPTWTVVELRSTDLADDAWAEGRTRFEREPDGHLLAHAIIPPPRIGSSGALFKLRQESMLLGYSFVRLGRSQIAAQAEPPLFQASRKPTPAPRPPIPSIEEELDLLFGAWSNQLTLLFLEPAEQFLPAVDAEARNVVLERVRRYCEHRRASCVFTTEAFAVLRAQGREPCGFSNTYVGTGHLNARGHAAAGRLLANEIMRIREPIMEARP